MPATIPEPVMDDLKARHAEPQRAYHTWAHIADMLQQYEAARPLLSHPFAFRLAVLFHDAIYDPKSATNESDSAKLLRTTMGHLAPEMDISCAEALILATQKHTPAMVQPPFLSDAQLFLDIDLSILGADEGRFDRYDGAIRQEYAFVPLQTYCEKRAEILQGFLDRPRIYFTDRYADRLENPARSNLKRAIRRLAATAGTTG
jgi:predicted metal-dependent HD superfamily phosphohydrolase